MIDRRIDQLISQSLDLFFNFFLFIRSLYLTHEWNHTCAVKSIPGESSHTGTLVATWQIRTCSVHTAVSVVVQSAFVDVWNTYAWALWTWQCPRFCSEMYSSLTFANKFVISRHRLDIIYRLHCRVHGPATCMPSTPPCLQKSTIQRQISTSLAQCRDVGP